MQTMSYCVEKSPKPEQAGAMPGWTSPKPVFQPFVPTPSGWRWKRFREAETNTAAGIRGSLQRTFPVSSSQRRSGARVASSAQSCAATWSRAWSNGLWSASCLSGTWSSSAHRSETRGSNCLSLARQAPQSKAGSLETLPAPCSHPCSRNHTLYLEISHFFPLWCTAVEHDMNMQRNATWQQELRKHSSACQQSAEEALGKRQETQSQQEQPPILSPAHNHRLPSLPLP